MIEFRPATAAAVDEFFGARPRQTVTAFVGYLEGKAVTIGGLAREGQVIKLFWDIAPGYEKHMRCMSVLRAIKRVMALAEKSPLPVVAVAGNPELLERLGFEHIGGDDYVWQTSQKRRARHTPDAPPDRQPKTSPVSSRTAQS